jgi:hypothetical protein
LSFPAATGPEAILDSPQGLLPLVVQTIKPGTLAVKDRRQGKMRLNSKSIALVALIVLTATPRVFDQLSGLKNSVEERFRTELIGLFRSFTTPETERTDARQQYSELLARAQQQTQTPSCDSSNEPRTTGASRAMTNGFAGFPPRANALGHREDSLAQDTSFDLLIAAAATGKNENASALDEAASTEKQEDVLVVARNFSDYPLFDEAYGPVAIDAAVAQLEWRREDEEAPALPDVEPAAFPKKALPRTERFTRKFVWTNIQNRLPENLEMKLDTIILNTDALIKTRDHLAPAKPKSRVRVVPAAPEAPRPVEKPAIIS